MKTLTLEQFQQACRDQKVPAREDIAMVCPMCGTVQSARDLIAAGAGSSFEEVEKYLGFSCLGRFTGAPGPRHKLDGKPCDWTLGGLFKTHKLEVLTPDGKRWPQFELATPEQARAHAQRATTEGASI